MSNINAATTFSGGLQSVDFGGHSAVYQSKQLGGKARRKTRKSRRKLTNTKRNKRTHYSKRK